MKKIALTLGIIALLLVGAVLALPFLVPKEKVVQLVSEQIKAATGRDFNIAGDISVKLWPTLAVEVGDITLSNASWGKAPQMVQAKSLAIALDVAPLLSGNVQINAITLDTPTITLERSPKGMGNWQFAAHFLAAPQYAAPQLTANDAQPTSPLPPQLKSLALEKLTIQNGTLHYRDMAAGKEPIEIQALNLAFVLPGLNDPLSLQADAKWQSETVKLDLKGLPLESFLGGKDSPITLTLSAPATKLSLNGQAKLAPQGFQLESPLDLSISNLHTLFAWLKIEDTLPSNLYHDVAVTGALTATPNQIKIADATLGMDSLKLQGPLDIRMGKAIPHIITSLTAETLDITPYLAPKEASTSSLLISSAHAETTEGWSTEPVDFSFLNSLTLDGNLHAVHFKADKFTAENLVLKASIEGGALTATLKDLALFGGSADFSATLAGTKSPKITSNLALEGVQIEPLLTTFADFKKLTGTGAMSWSLATSGANQKAWVENLGGNLKINLANGKIKGIDLAAMARNLTGSFDNNTEQSTDFTEIKASGAITGGILTSNDLSAFSPFLRVGGAGKVMLPAQQIDYRLEPKIVGTKEGQGGKADVGGLTVPILIDGPLSKPRFRPDLAGMAKSVLENPEAAKEQLQNLKGSASSIKDALKDPAAQEQLLKGLFGQ